MDEAVMQFTKWGGRPHWHFPMESLGNDEHGLWFMVRPKTPLRRGDEAPIERADGFVVLVPNVGEWIGCWNLLDDMAIYIDVTTAPVLSNGLVTAVDLDLDVVRWRSGEVEVLDVDEFERHQVELGYPTKVVRAAEETSRQLVTQVQAEQPPFDGTGFKWLDIALARGGFGPDC